jgi:hypothetical protein
MRGCLGLALALAAALGCVGCTTAGANAYDAAVDGEEATDATAIDAGGASIDACCVDGMPDGMPAILDAGGPDSGSDAGLSCQLGGTCSPSQVCMTGIVGCESDCQCVHGTWQSPCPDAGMPPSGSSCNTEGAACGYLTNGNACGTAAVDCYCQAGTWACKPSCNTPLDAGPDAGGCIAAGGECLNSNVICSVQGSLSCGAVYPGAPYCCMSNVGDCGQPSATTYACPPAQPDGGMTCTRAPIPLGAPYYQALVQANDTDASYPVGCRVTFPACNNGHVPYCTCKFDGMVPGWTCFQ